MAAEISFGTDGWRGVVADDFTYANVRAVSQAVAAYLGGFPPEGRVVVGHDTRFCAELFAREVARVLAANGRPVTLLDRPAPTQASAWLVVATHALGGVVVTASHNPPEFNGLKYKPDYGGSASQEVVTELERHLALVLADEASVRTMAFDDALASGLIEYTDPRSAYEEQLGRMVDLAAIRAAGLRVLHEAMYGAGAGYLGQALRGGKTEVVELHCERNPGFGGMHPEPILRYMPEAHQRMLHGDLDLGIANDGDADRVGIFDEQGGFIDQLEVASLLLWHLLENRGWRGPVVRSLTSTGRLDRLAERYGCEAVELPVGFKYLGPEMRARDAILGAEESGGFGFRGHIPERDGILSGLFFAEMIVTCGEPLSQIRQRVRELVGPRSYSRRDHRYPRDQYPAARRRLTERMASRPVERVAGMAVSRRRSDDGYKFWFDDGSWVLVRMSGTEPLMRVYGEAEDEAQVTRLLDAFETELGITEAAG